MITNKAHPYTPLKICNACKKLVCVLGIIGGARGWGHWWGGVESNYMYKYSCGLQLTIERIQWQYSLLT